MQCKTTESNSFRLTRISFTKKVPLRRNEVLLPYASGFFEVVVYDDGILCINLSLGLASFIVTVEGGTLKGIHSVVQLVES